MGISALILAKNESTNLSDCLASLAWCDERIVVDDNSTDDTAAIAKKYNATVVRHDLQADFSQQRNFALTKAKNEWVFFVDADERVSQNLATEIQKKLAESTRYDGFMVRRLDSMWGKVLMHGEQGDIKLLRLAKKESGKWVGKVHEVWHVKGKVGMLDYPLLHFPHQTLAEFLREINTYSTIRAEELYEKGVRANMLSIILHAKGKFLQDYIYKGGFLDGTEGFLVAMLMGFHAFLVRGKLWQKTNK